MADQKAPGDELALPGADPSGNQRQGECLGLRWKPTSSAVDDSGTESGEDLRLLSPEVLKEIQNALSRLEGVLPGLEPLRRDTVSQLVNRLQSCLRIPPPSVPPVPPPRRFGNKKAIRNRHTVGVTREELADARRWLSESNMQRQSSSGSLPTKDESIVAKVFRPVRFSPPPPVTEKVSKYRPPLQKMELIRKVYRKPILHRAGYFMEPAPQVAVITYVDPYINVKVERSLSDTGSLLDYDPSLNLFTPEQSVQIAVHKAAINKQISREEMKRRESSDDGDISSAEEDNINGFSHVSSAQRLLQLASDNPKPSTTPSRFHNRSTKKQKIKRANTIDIPKPTQYYDHSSGEEFGASADEGNHSDYVSPSSRKYGEKKLPPPIFQPKTENDLKFLAFLKQANESAQSKVLTYNPRAGGGKHWSNRFSNIRTAFEGPDAGSNHIPPKTSPSPAKLFWQNPHPETNSASRTGTPQQSHSKLPWSVKAEEDGVVIGSLTVAKRPPGPINQFTHAPKSAFKPVEKKSSVTLASNNSQLKQSSASGTVKQLATQKFSVEPQKVGKDYISQEKSHIKTQPQIPNPVKSYGNPSQQFSSSTTASHRYFNVPQNLTSPKRRETQQGSNSNKPLLSKVSSNDKGYTSSYNPLLSPSRPVNYSSNLEKKKIEPSKTPYSPNLERKLIEPIKPIFNNKMDRKIEPIKPIYSSNIEKKIEPTKPVSFNNNQQVISVIQSITPTTNGLTTKQLLEEKYSKMSNENPVEYPPAESFLKEHPRYPSLTDQSFENSPIHNNTFDTRRDSYERTVMEPQNFSPPTEPTNYFSKSVVQNNGKNQCFESQQYPLKDSHASNYSYNSRDISTIGNDLVHNENVIRPVAHNHNIPTVGLSNSPTSQFANFTHKPESPLEHCPNQTIPQVHYPLLSPHSIPPPHPTNGTSPISIFNNVSPRPITNSDRGLNSVSPIGTQYSKSPSSIKYDDDESASASPFLWNKDVMDEMSNRSTPHEPTEVKVAVSKVMGQAQCQQAVTVNNRTRHRFDTGKKNIESELKLQVQQSARQKALSPSFPNVLQKSESWHQIVKEQMQQAKQAPPLPKISKAKSSHSLAFPKQFEAAVPPEKLSMKQSTVSQYLSQTKVSPPTKKQNAKPVSKSRDSALNEDDLDNVDEAFESIFRESNRKRNSK